MGEAKKKRENTIKEVDALDQQQLEEYKVSECGASNRRVLLFYQTDNAGRIVKI
ncbi:hypothetical protein [Metabacillus halosaccharovorans]|uniref:hypothetical protein n=1 Tax=Metabacillus halosaccharovorans TaxID=930124 RepID=UPI001C1F906E|nr:hypothetical protein [Metabacillus halosaccharovorans]